MTKIVLLTGVSGGLGSAIAKKLSSKGYKVYGTSRNPIESTNQDFIPVQMDLTDSASISRVVKNLIAKEKKIDILINNAGIGITGSIEETSLEAVRLAFETNFFGTMQLIQEVLPHMRKQKSGTLINISSIAGYTGLPYRGIYSATKAAVMRITEALSAEVKSFGIRIIDIAPGDFNTDIAKGRIYAENKKESPYFKDYERVLKMMDEEVESGLNPKVLGNKIDRILNLKTPKLKYNIGIFMQRLTPCLVTCLPSRFFEKLIRNHYKIR